ncbi:MAG: Cro/CI family transcriptional regulator [Acetobacter sp.]|uniref:transcriptional regulator n=1 Tax=Acetobacter sp. TaxID=440 RepID=UPI0039ED16B2
MTNDPLKDVIAKVGGVVELARSLNISSQAVSQWKKVPLSRIIEVEKITGIDREMLRPELAHLFRREEAQP